MKSALVWLLALALAATPLTAKHRAVEKAKAAVESGDLVPERDLAPLIEALANSRDVDEKRELVGAIDDLAEADSDSPNAAKLYLREKATPVLLDVIKNGNDPFLQGDAVFALRSMPAPRAILEQAAALAEADPNSYVQSRGEILRGFIRSMPIESAATATRPVDPEQAKAGIAYLDKRGITLSTDALREAAKRADPETVKALLDAGIAPDTGVTTLGETPLYYATYEACMIQGAETDWLVETVQLLVNAGASLTFEDDNQNTVMTHAADQCGPRIINVLAKAGCEIDRQNGSGFSPLGMAFMMSKLDAVEALVELGARLTKEEQEMLKTLVTEERAKTLFGKASGG